MRVYTRFVPVEPAEVACVCATARMAARALTRVYDRALEPAGIRTSQFSILARLFEEGPLSLTHLAGRLAMDRTTLARDLRPLERRGLVSVSVGSDRRVRMAALTPAGRRLVDEVRPRWKEVQRDVRAQLGPDHVARLMGELRAATALNPAPAPRT
jgi:DNA-binding MarR family transcriptional regulator